MFLKARQANLIDVPKLALLYELHKEPERQTVRAVHQQLPHQEVHTLHIVRLIIVAAERPQNSPQLHLPKLSSLEERVLWKRSSKISINLQGTLLLRHKVREALVVFLTLLILLHYQLTDLQRRILLLPLPNFHEKNISCKPLDRLLACEPISVIFAAFTFQLLIDVLQLGVFLLLRYLLNLERHDRSCRRLFLALEHVAYLLKERKRQFLIRLLRLFFWLFLCWFNRRWRFNLVLVLVLILIAQKVINVDLLYFLLPSLFRVNDMLFLDLQILVKTFRIRHIMFGHVCL